MEKLESAETVGFRSLTDSAVIEREQLLEVALQSSTLSRPDPVIA